MVQSPTYDVAIIGGGLAGLASSILLARKGYKVVLFEKETYPFHKVCGEYISMESWDFLRSLGLPLLQWALPRIDTLQVTAPNGKAFVTRLPLGGFGVSRYKLDHALAAIAKGEGVHLFENTKVNKVESGELFSVFFDQVVITSKLCLGTYGKRSNLDVKWKRSFLQLPNSRVNNFVGVKYHVKMTGSENVIGLHNFSNGYCGISKIEDDLYCLCYLTRSENLKANGNSIPAMQENVLYQNPHLQAIFTQAAFVKNFPVTISQISFAKKKAVENGLLMLGDAAGMITPLCGNGMSIALHTAKIASTLCHTYLQNKLSKAELETAYAAEWQQLFAARVRNGRWLQTFFGSAFWSNLFVSVFQKIPVLAKPVIRQTHGKPF